MKADYDHPAAIVPKNHPAKIDFANKKMMPLQDDPFCREVMQQLGERGIVPDAVYYESGSTCASLVKTQIGIAILPEGPGKA